MGPANPAFAEILRSIVQDSGAGLVQDSGAGLVQDSGAGLVQDSGAGLVLHRFRAPDSL